MTYALKADSVALTTMINKLSSGCKPEQIIRELWMNALEAIVRGTPPGQEPKGEILITRDKERPLKAVFCNSDADPLTKQVVGRHLLSLGSSGNSNTDNFGIGAGDPTKAICSTLIAEAFKEINHPILPFKDKSKSVIIRHPSFCLPKDFDISPFFQIIKPSPQNFY